MGSEAGIYTQQAAGLIGMKMRQAGNQALPLDAIIAIILQMLPFLSTICGKKTPQQAVDHLTWTPAWWFPWGYYSYKNRLGRFRSEIEQTANANLRDGVTMPSSAWEAIWSNIDAGNFDNSLATGLYRECVPGYR